MNKKLVGKFVPILQDQQRFVTNIVLFPVLLRTINLFFLMIAAIWILQEVRQRTSGRGQVVRIGHEPADLLNFDLSKWHS